MYDHERSLVDDYEGRPFALLGVNTDKSLAVVKKAIKENNLNWRSWYDGKGGDIVKSYGVRSFPTILVVDHTGVIRYKNVRGGKLDDAIEELVSAAEDDGMTGGAPMREFTDASGDYSMVGSYSHYQDGKVFLTKEDGEEISLGWSKLSLEDRQYIASIRLKKSGYSFASRNIEYQFDRPNKFVDVTGQHSMEGTYMGLNKGDAIIWNTDGRELTLSRKKLNEETLELIKQITKERKARE